MSMSEWLQRNELETVAGRHIEQPGEAEEFKFLSDEFFERWGSKPSPKASKYHREIKPGVTVDVYDVLQAWRVDNPALQHLIKKALQAGQRGHKSRDEDLADIVASAIRARELG